MRLNAPTFGRGVSIAGIMPKKLPEILSGNYRVLKPIYLGVSIFHSGKQDFLLLNMSYF